MSQYLGLILEGLLCMQSVKTLTRLSRVTGWSGYCCCHMNIAPGLGGGGGLSRVTGWSGYLLLSYEHSSGEGWGGGGGDQIIFSSFLHKTYCEYSLEVPHQGTSNEYQKHVFLQK